MTLTQFRAFLAAATTGSFTAAARELQTTQPTVSELVRKLEDESGLPLFARSSRRLTLTAAGEELLPVGTAGGRRRRRGCPVPSGTPGPGGGVAAFGVLRNAPFYFLSDLVQRFHDARPGMNIRLVGQNSVEVAEAVRSGRLEAGLVVLPIQADNLDVEPIMRDEVLWVSADSVKTASPVRIEDLASADLVLYDAHYGWSDPTRRQLAGARPGRGRPARAVDRGRERGVRARTGRSGGRTDDRLASRHRASHLPARTSIRARSQTLFSTPSPS